MRGLFAKTPQGMLMPCDPAAIELLSKLRLGQETWVEVVRARNTQFHKKFFALLGVGFDAWEPPAIEGGPYEGVQPEKDFEVFRKDIVKLAGFVDVHVSVDGTAIVQAKSVSFDKMDQDEFERLYSRAINVLLQLVLRGRSESELRAWVDRILHFS